AKESTNLKTYKAKMLKDVNKSAGMSEVTIEGFNYHIGHPTLNSQETAIYFISDAPGGAGGMDIYTSHLVDNKWTSPKSLGEVINTNGDEMHPFIFNDSILYFASDGHGGYGGLDLYSVNLKDTLGTVVNLGNQINTAFDDYSLFLTPEGQTGYFSSNRPGEAGKPSSAEATAGKEDIYKLDILHFKMKYTGYRYRRRSSMEDDKVNLWLSNGGEYNITANSSGDYEFDFQPSENYKIIIQ
ncbi:unnamed protein product, partial [marine sediment metagenome]